MLSLSRRACAALIELRRSDRVWADWGTLMGGLLVIVVSPALAYQRRWVSDDGTIVVARCAKILAGMGPNYNPFQRTRWTPIHCGPGCWPGSPSSGR